jgi:hypothetical protein
MTLDALGASDECFPAQLRGHKHRVEFGSKTISKPQYETPRSDFRAVSGDLSLLEASQLLAP